MKTSKIGELVEFMVRDAHVMAVASATIANDHNPLGGTGFACRLEGDVRGDPGSANA